MIIDLQRRLAEIGRIRIGQQVPTKGGKTRPEKLDTFRLTSANKALIDRAAAAYGGTPQAWQAPAGSQWEVITSTDALDVIVPPSDMAFSQHYELWSAGGCQRRCDGQTEAITQGPCLCDPDARECDIHTRLSVMLRDLPGLGVWRIDTSGYYAAVELQGAVHVIQLAAGRGEMLPARLRLEQRQVKRQVDGQPQTRRFAVPVLDVEVSPGQLIGTAQRAAITATAVGELDGSARLTPVPAALPQWPTSSIAEQAAAVENEQPPKPRRNAAQPIPRTGRKPRTAAQATQADQDTIPARRQTSDQQKALHAAFNERGFKTHDQRVTFSSRVIGRQLDSTADLDFDQTSRVIDVLNAGPPKKAEPDPAAEPNFDDGQETLT